MMKKMQKTVCLLLALLFTVCGLFACQNPETEGGTPARTISLFDETGASAYKIIRPADCTALLREEVKNLRSSIETLTGVKLASGDDWVAGSGTATYPTYEILIGRTNRPETAEILSDLSYNDYAIAVVNEKLVICGGSDPATLVALTYFEEEMMKAPFTYSEGLLYQGTATTEQMIFHVRGEEASTVTEIYENVYRTTYKLSAGSYYGLQVFSTVEFNPRQSGLYFLSTCLDPTDITKLGTVEEIVKSFNARNGEGLKALDAINGDLWMVTYAHARVEGSGTSYGGQTNAVVTASFNTPRCFDVYEGEIVTSMHIAAETPYEDPMYSFGITPDGVPVLGQPQLHIAIKNGNRTIQADGLNRLPADNALILYSHSVKTTRSLSDALEIVVECGDYTVRHGAFLQGTVTAIYDENTEENPVLTATSVVLTARGDKKALLESFAVGDEVTINFTVTDNMGNHEAWQQMENAVGGHVPLILDGESTNPTDISAIPTTLYGIKENGNVVLLINDGRQKGYSTGFTISQLDDLCKELGIVTAFISDGGGSTTLYELQADGSYALMNVPSDTFSDGSYGKPRSVAGAVILAIKP